MATIIKTIVDKETSDIIAPRTVFGAVSNGMGDNLQDLLDTKVSQETYLDTITTINGKTGIIVKADITALGIPAQDTVYEHPATHSADIITDGTTNKTFTAVLKSAYDGLVTIFSGISSVVTTLGPDNTSIPTSKAVADAISGAGGGDMLRSTYDPSNIVANVYNADNHIDGTTNKVFTATEQTKLGTIAENANNYTHPTTAGNKHIPTGGTVGQILKNTASGTATWQADNDTVTTIVNNLTETVAGKALDATQGKALAEQISTKASFKNGSATFTAGGTTYQVTDAFITTNTLVTIIPTSEKQGAWSVVSNAGSFTITSDTVETVAVTFDWGAVK